MKTYRPNNDRNGTGAELASYSVYFGRERLGRFVRLDRRDFEAFDCQDRSLGTFLERRLALCAIYAVSDEPR